MPRRSLHRKRTFWLFASIAAIGVRVGGASSTLGCIRAGIYQTASRALTDHPAPPSVLNRASPCQSALGIAEAVPIADVPNAGVGQTMAPCVASDRSAPRIEANLFTLQSANGRA